MATSAATLSEALELYNDRYQSALETKSRRTTERFSSNWNQINAYYDIVIAAGGENNVDRAEDALDEIVSILGAEGITISEDVDLPYATSIFNTPSIITVPVDQQGVNPDYTNANARLKIYQGGADLSDRYTFTINAQTNVTANISDTNLLSITDLTDDQGSVEVKAERNGYDDLTFRVDVYKYYDAQAGLSVDVYPSTIVIPSDSDGSSPQLGNAFSEIIVREGNVDDTNNYTFSVITEVNVTAVIQNDNEVKINAITDDEGSVTVRGTKPDYPDQDVYIPVQKQRKGQAVVDNSSVDNLTIDLNTSDELILKRDDVGEANIFGDNPDINSFETTSDNFIFKSSIYRKSEDNTKRRNIESTKSVITFESFDNIVLGDDNVVDVYENDGESADAISKSSDTSGLAQFNSALGDLTSYYTIGSKIVIYVDEHAGVENDGVYYYLTGTITNSVYTTQTTVVFDTDSTFYEEIADYFLDVFNAGGLFYVTVYEPFDDGFNIGSYNNQIFGNDNFIKGRDQILFGRGNRSDGGIGNNFYGDGWRVRPTAPDYFGLKGNILIGKGLDWGGDASVIKGHANIIMGYGGNNICDSDETNFNIIIGDFNASGEYATPQTFGSIQNTIVGFRNRIPSNFSLGIGFGARSTTNGEISFGATDSPVGKSVFLLEGQTSATGLYFLKTLQRASSSGINPASYAQNVQMNNDSMMYGVLDLTGVKANENTYRRRVPFIAVCNNAGTVSIKQGSNIDGGGISQYNQNDFSVNGAQVNGGTNEFEVEIDPDDTDATNWTCLIEVVITDN